MGRSATTAPRTLGVIFALGLGVWFAGCDSTSTTDAGQAVIDPCATSTVKAGDACQGGVCLAETSGKFTCHASCTALGSTCVQSDGVDGTCYQWGSKDQLACMPIGSGNLPSTCSTSSDCTSGAQCLEVGGATHCYIVCTGTCETGVCTDTGHGFKVCMGTSAP